MTLALHASQHMPAHGGLYNAQARQQKPILQLYSFCQKAICIRNT